MREMKAKKQFNSKIFVLNGPSASGKTMVMEELIKKKELNLEKLVTVTTREPRVAPVKEIDGKDYYFITREEFIKRKSKDSLDQIVEETEYPKGSGVLYGIFASEINRIRNLGKNAIVILDLHGISEMKRFYGEENVVSIFLYRDIKDIEKALRERNLPEKEIQSRLKFAEKEYENQDNVDFVVENIADKDSLFEKIEEIIRLER